MKKPQINIQQFVTYVKAHFGNTCLLIKQRIDEHNRHAWSMRFKHEDRIRVKFWPTLQLEQNARFRMLPVQQLHYLPRIIKGNVRATLFETMRLFLSRHKRKIEERTNYRLYTWNTSLAGLTHNSVRTIQRHLGILSKEGFLRAIERTGRGLALVLDRSLLSLEVVTERQQQASQAPEQATRPAAPAPAMPDYRAALQALIAPTPPSPG